MIDEAIEAAARAIWEQQCQHWGRYRDSIPDLCAWEELSESKQRELIREARAAAPALMEEGARLALEAAAKWLRDVSDPGATFQDRRLAYQLAASEFAEEIAQLDPATIVKGAGHD